MGMPVELDAADAEPEAVEADLELEVVAPPEPPLVTGAPLLPQPPPTTTAKPHSPTTSHRCILRLMVAA
jgi:hypothetical protein